MQNHGDLFYYLEKITLGAICAQSTPVVTIYTALVGYASNIFLLRQALYASKTLKKRLNGVYASSSLIKISEIFLYSPANAAKAEVILPLLASSSIAACLTKSDRPSFSPVFLIL